MRCSEFLYPGNIARCQHIKVNGTQCGSPALKRHKYCFFHQRWHESGLEPKKIVDHGYCFSQDLPLLEDANSIQVALMVVMYKIMHRLIDEKRASLLLYALQTASANLRRIRFEPQPTDVVIDRRRIRDTALGDAAWYKEEFTDEEASQEESALEASAESEQQAAPVVSQPKRPANVADWTGEEAMAGLKQAIAIMDEIEEHSDSA